MQAALEVLEATLHDLDGFGALVDKNRLPAPLYRCFAERPASGEEVENSVPRVGMEPNDSGEHAQRLLRVPGLLLAVGTHDRVPPAIRRRPSASVGVLPRSTFSAPTSSGAM